MKLLDNIWFAWLILVVIWNFGWPEVHPISDVIVAVILSIGVIIIKNKKK